MKNTGSISFEDLENYRASYESDPAKRAITNIFSKAELKTFAFNPVNARKMLFKFSDVIPTMKATNQKSSGRCWLFAATNVLREVIGKKKNIENFELSQSYLAFWDKFERVNYFFESIIDTASLPTTDRTVHYILHTGIQDGGQWDMFVNIVKKYGIVPKDAMPETAQTSATGQLNSYINRFAKRVACDIRKAIENKASAEEIEKMKKAALDKVFSFLCECFTEPPKEFDFEYISKDKQYHIEKGYTPISFRDEMIGNMLDDYVSIINAPTKDKPFDDMYTVAYLGNMVGDDKIVRHLNLEMDEFKSAVRRQMEAGEPVWFGSDCSKCNDRDDKIWDTSIFDYEVLTGFDFNMSKEDMLNFGVSQMNHAMVLTGFNLDDGKITRWKVENSWGSDGVNEGYHIASDAWFDLFVYQAVVNKKYLGEKADLLSKEPKVLCPWDPMGSLAD